jgi:integrating conjugative element membrane protein (TIGR03747 family)
MSTRAASVKAAAGPAGPVSRGPIGIAIEIVFGGALATVFAWLIGVLIAYGGMHVAWLWQDKGIAHARGLVEENLRFVAEYPRSVIIEDTLGFEQQVIDVVARPFIALGVLKYYEDSLQPITRSTSNLARTSALLKRELAKIFMVAMYIAMDTAMRLFVVVFALPAFLLACLLGIVDGLVRRDLRRWGGGRESSFVYHRAKKATVWSISGGFGIYLAWPFGGFNPAYMVLIFTVLVAASLSMYVSTFKKYL